MNSKNITSDPILHFRNEDISEASDVPEGNYSILLGTHEKGQGDGYSYNYSTMMTRSREAVDSSEHSHS